jgi:HlyD family secretion protein
MTNRKLIPVLILSALLAVTLAGCGALPGGEEPADAAATTPVAVGPAVISATGEVLPAQEATLGFRQSGQVLELLVEVGDEVQEGDVIGRLDDTVQASDVASAEAAIAVAQANLERVRTGARAEQIDEAEANLAAAGANTNSAAAQRDQVNAGPTDAQIYAAQAALQQAFINLHYARISYELSDDRAAVDNFEIATLQYRSAQAALDRLLAGPNEIDARAAQADYWAAAAEFNASEANLAAVERGPLDEDIVAAEAAVTQAESGLVQAELALAQTVLTAPFSGTVSELYIREAEYVTAGQPVVLLADLVGLYVETTDLNEIDVAQLSEGDTAIVTFDALPGVEVDGTVESIAPRAEEGAGVNFTVNVALSDVPADVRWGMTAFVDIPFE